MLSLPLKNLVGTVINKQLLSSVTSDFLVVALGRDTPVPFAFPTYYNFKILPLKNP